MPYIFVDNFRGFSGTLIPIKDVNFIVGENSTGKTSILGLLQLFASDAFWFYQTFDTAEVNFGHFDDMVSVNAKDRSYFSVGLVSGVWPLKETEKQKQKEKQDGKAKNPILIRAFLMTFANRRGIPTIERFSFRLNEHEVHIQFLRKGIAYKYQTAKPSRSTDEFISRSYLAWPKMHRQAVRGYRTVDAGGARTPLLAMRYVEKDLSERSGKISFLKSDFGSFASPWSFVHFMGRLAWLAPIRTKPRRTYDEYKRDFSPEGEHTPFLIKKIFETKKEAKRFKTFLGNVGKDSGLFESIQIKSFGRTNVSPFELDVLLNRKALSISNVGYGVSQSLPVIVEIFVRPKGSWFNVQQPEVHLHPKAQAALGDVLFGLATREDKKFLVETHSDYMIDRFRMNYDKKRKVLPSAQILFFERSGKGNKMSVIRINNDGTLPSAQPEGYRAFFIKEKMRLLGI